MLSLIALTCSITLSSAVTVTPNRLAWITSTWNGWRISTRSKSASDKSFVSGCPDPTIMFLEYVSLVTWPRPAPRSPDRRVRAERRRRSRDDRWPAVGLTPHSISSSRHTPEQGPGSLQPLQRPFSPTTLGLGGGRRLTWQSDRHAALEIGKEAPESVGDFYGRSRSGGRDLSGADARRWPPASSGTSRFTSRSGRGCSSHTRRRTAGVELARNGA